MVKQEITLKTDNNAGIRALYNYSWTKFELFIDYNSNSTIFFQNYEIEFDISNEIPDNLEIKLSNNYPSTTFLTKYDNFKISALQTLPSHLVSVRDFVSSKFNVFPNPVTEMVTITNSKSISIEQIEILISAVKP